jgi:hypothetical protein
MIEVDDIGNERHAMCDLCFACISSLGLLLKLHSIYCYYVRFFLLAFQVVVHMCGLHPCSQDLLDYPLLFQFYVIPSCPMHLHLPLCQPWSHLSFSSWFQNLHYHNPSLEKVWGWRFTLPSEFLFWELESWWTPEPS